MKMSHSEALRILGCKTGCSFDEIKSAYRRSSIKYHPDRNPAGLEMMKLVNGAWSALSDYVAVESCNDECIDLGDELNAALNAIISLGLTIEICGSWIWVSGDTFPHRAVLKEAGYRWAPTKKMWSFGERKSYSRGGYDMDTIRAKHGSVSVKSKSYARLSA